MYGHFPFSFTFQFSSGQRCRCTEDGMSTFCKFKQHIFRNTVPFSLRTVFGRIPLFLRTWSNERPLTNSKSSCKRFHKVCMLPLPSQEMSLNIEIKRILPVKASGVCPKELSRLLILPQSCNVVNPGLNIPLEFR